MIGCGGTGRAFPLLPSSLSVLDCLFVIRKTGEEMSKSGFSEPSSQRLMSMTGMEGEC